MRAHVQDHGWRCGRGFDIRGQCRKIQRYLRPGHSRSGRSWLGVHRPASIDMPTQGLRHDQNEKIHPGWLCQGCSRSYFISCTRNLQTIVMPVLHFCFPDQQLMTVMTPYPIVYLVTAGTLWCKNTQSHSNFISTGVQTAFHTDIPSRPANVITKPLPPPLRGNQWKAESIKTLFFLILHWRILDLRARDARRVRGGTSARCEKKNHAFVCRA